MTTPEDHARAARERFVRWVEWYLRSFPDESGRAYSQEKFAKDLLKVTPPTVSGWRQPGSTTYPTMLNVIRFFLLVEKKWPGVRIDDLLFREPPPDPRR